MKNHLFYLILVNICLLACNSDSHDSASSEKMMSDYYIRYLASEKQIKAEASFSKADTSQNFMPYKVEGDVKFQGKNMGHRELPDKTIRYNFENYIEYPSKFTFEFRNSSGKNQKQVLELPPLVNFAIQGDVSQKNGGILSLEDNEFQDGESIVMLLSDLRTNTITIEFNLTAESSSLEIPSARLLELEPGAIRMYLVRKKIQTIEEKAMVINSTIEYYSKDSGFVLIE